MPYRMPVPLRSLVRASLLLPDPPHSDITNSKHTDSSGARSSYSNAVREVYSSLILHPYKATIRYCRPHDGETELALKERDAPGLFGTCSSEESIETAGYDLQLEDCKCSVGTDHGPNRSSISFG